MARIRSSPFVRRYEVAPPEVIEKLHDATLRVLERTGVRIGSERVQGRLADAGANVDFDNGRVRFAPEFVEEKLALAPGAFFEAARDPECDLQVGSGRGYLGMDGCPSDILDLDTGERRRSTAEDLHKLAVIADAIPEVAYVWTAVAANDSPAATRTLHEFYAKVTGTSKHMLQNALYTELGARGIVEMSRAVAGGSDELRARPIVSNYQVCMSPLAWEAGGMDAMVVFADAGIPVGMCCMNIAMASAPASVAGTVVLANAEVVSGMVVLETLYPGHPTYYVAYPTSMDIRDGSIDPGWGPEELMMQGACQQLARRYGIPVHVGLGGTGAKTQNWQAGLQNALAAFLGSVMPGDLMSDAGSLLTGLVYSYESLLLDTEIYGLLCDMWETHDFGDEATGLDVIDAVGPGGLFLGQQHTLAHMRDFWMPRFFDRSTWEDWEESGRPEPADKAREQVREILATHEPQPLDADLDAELRRILAAYDEEATEG